MYTIALLEQFNNYFNRRIIRYDLAEEYFIHQNENEKNYYTFNANFIPNDGITTEHIINAQTITWNPDYCLIIDAENNIYQRWFVIDSVRTTMGQYKLSLKRDTISDYYTEAINAPCFVEKATLSDNNPLIYNTENFTVNQIKQKEEFLKDRTNTPWIVGYLSNGDLDLSVLDGATPYPSSGAAVEYYTFDVPDKAIENATSVVDFYEALNIDRTVVNLNGNKASSAMPLKEAALATKNTERYFQFNFEKDAVVNVASVAMVFDGNGNLSDALADKVKDRTFNDDSIGIYSLKHGKEQWEIKNSKIPELAAAFKNNTNVKAYLNSAFNAYIDSEFNGSQIYQYPSLSALNNYVGKKYYEPSTGTLYSVQSLDTQYILGYEEITDPTITSYLKGIFYGNLNYKKYLSNPDKYEPGEKCFYIGVKVPVYTLTVNTSVVGKLRYSLPANIRLLEDNPYRMFCMPLYSAKYSYESSKNPGTYHITDSKNDICFTIAMDISKKLSGAGWLTDLQILPYCPAQYWLSKSGETWRFDLSQSRDTSLIENTDFTYIQTGVGVGSTLKYTNASFILFPNKSSTSFTINHKIPVIDKKVQNQCDFQRLCSPNYASAFQFNAVKNNGVDYFTVNMTCKPWSPFIQIYPNFKELYGNDFNDNRGLILAGEFSLPQVNDAWNTYELNNKTYQASFDRQIENMEVLHKQEMIGNAVSAIGGSISASAKGAGFGLMVGGPVGAVVGGVAGGVASLAAGGADLLMSQFAFKENRDLAKDQFGFNLSNIQALPNTLSKTTCLTINHKLYPFIEFYSCTEQEKVAFKNKLKFNGMTVGIISDLGIAPYILETETYIKGQLIELSIADDAHVSQDIFKELAQGVRIKK